jgi:mono/diheme cytochrome c family protein
MGTKRHSCVIGTAVVILVVPTLAHAAAAPEHGATIEVWVRKPLAGSAGQPAAKGAGRDRLQVVSLDSLPLVEAKQVDVQYHGAFVFKGIGVDMLIARYAPPPDVDLALLHFANGMQVPLAFRDAEVVKRLSPFLARGMQLGPGSPMRIARFPNVSRPRSGFVDVRPIAFTGNKLVIADPAHPDVPLAAREALSPWAQTDTLTGIEFVSRAAYYAQFDVDSDPAAKAGHKLFTESCTFCHGVRGTGAAFGWDFVEPTPIYDYRKARNLFHHIRYKPLDASARGIQMPALSYMSEEEARSIWVWLKAVATHPLAPYAPK